MGHGGYDSVSRTVRAKSSGYYDQPLHKTFSQREIHQDMRPLGIKLRESRDSQEHPNSVPIIINLDLTGSMGAVPGQMVKNGLPHIVDAIMEAGIPDPQILFVGIGDHETDNSPLQVGQFESSDKLMDKWLTNTYIEKGGGANGGESYLLAWFFAARYTKHDALEKRGQKGFLFTIGDEPNLQTLPANVQKELMGEEGQYSDETADSLLAKAREKYDVYHIHLTETWQGSIEITQDDWKQVLGNNLIIAQSHTDVPKIISSIVAKGASNVPTETKTDDIADQEPQTEQAPDNVINDAPTML